MAGCWRYGKPSNPQVRSCSRSLGTWVDSPVHSSPSMTSMESNGQKPITFGICAMAKKTGGKPMREILKRLAKYNDFEIVIFPEEMILNQPIEEWPVCDALLSWFSTGFPLHKAVAYADMTQPFLVNALRSQSTLMDRREVFRR